MLSRACKMHATRCGCVVQSTLSSSSSMYKTTILHLIQHTSIIQMRMFGSFRLTNWDEQEPKYSADAKHILQAGDFVSCLKRVKAMRVDFDENKRKEDSEVSLIRLLQGMRGRSAKGGYAGDASARIKQILMKQGHVSNGRDLTDELRSMFHQNFQKENQTLMQKDSFYGSPDFRESTTASSGAANPFGEAFEERGYERDPFDIPSEEEQQKEMTEHEFAEHQIQKVEEIKSQQVVLIRERQTVRQLADALNIRVPRVKRALTFLTDGVYDSVTLTDTTFINAEHAELVALDFGMETEREFSNEGIAGIRAAVNDHGTSDVGSEPRAPVICVMGHVDHGKTTLLDYLRSSNVAEGEAGGITQSIGAFRVAMEEDSSNQDKDNAFPIDFATFLDTPGHAAFHRMRARGASTGLSDIAVLVVDAVDGVRPQTVEAIKLIQRAKSTFMVALNKSDRADADMPRTKMQLAQHGVVVEDLGGDVPCATISALKGTGMDDLRVNLMLMAEMLELRCDRSRNATGFIVESNALTGSGVNMSVLVRNGTLRVDDVFVCGSRWGRVKRMTNSAGDSVLEAGPSEAVVITGLHEGWKGMEGLADDILVIQDEEMAREAAWEQERKDEAEHAVELAKTEALAVEMQEKKQRERKEALKEQGDSVETGYWKHDRHEKLLQKIDFDSQIRQENERQDDLSMGWVLRADSAGALDVLKDYIDAFPTQEVEFTLVDAAVREEITEEDVEFAKLHGARLLGFNVEASESLIEAADKDGVSVFTHSIVYQIMDHVRDAASALLPSQFVDRPIGHAKLKQVFMLNGKTRRDKIPCAGCELLSGAFEYGEDVLVSIQRDGEVVLEPTPIQSLRYLKDEVDVISEGEFGLVLRDPFSLKEGDELECVRRKLEHIQIDDSIARHAGNQVMPFSTTQYV